MLRQVAAFELRQQLRSHVFWVVFAISALMVFGSVTIEQIRIGPVHQGLRNSPLAIAQVHLIWTLFYMFTTTAFVADAVLRDDLSGFAPIIRTTAVRKLDYLLGRFAGAFAASVLCFLSVPLALMSSAWAPWLDPARLSPFEPGVYLFAFGVLALPNLLLSSAVFFALATITRSMTAAYSGAVALLVAYGLGTGPLGQSMHGPAAALLEPFGLGAYALAVEGWTDVERDARLPALTGVLAYNRLLWMAASAALILTACVVFRFEARAFAGGGSRDADGTRRAGGFGVADRFGASDGRSPADGACQTQVGKHSAAAPPLPVWPPPSGQPVAQRFGWRVGIAQLAARTRLELRQVFQSPVFAVLILLGLANAAGAAWATLHPADLQAPGAAGAVVPTDQMIDRLVEAFRLVPMTVVLFYAGELVWNERDRRIHEMTATAPVPDWALLMPKLLAMVLIVCAMLLASAATAIGAQAAAGQSSVEPAAYVTRYVLPQTIDWTLVAVLAFFFQAVSPNKVAGWGWMVLYLIVSLALHQLGLDNSLYRYGSHPPGEASSRIGPFELPLASLYRAYWAALALVLLVLAHALSGRGTDNGFALRLRRLPRRLKGPLGALAAAAATTFITLGVLLARLARP